MTPKKKTSQPKDQTEKPSPRPSPFGTIAALSETRPLTYSDLQQRELPYEAFLVNRSFSLTEDTILIASMMNQRPFLDKDVQATFYINTVRPRKRWSKWPKGVEDKDGQVVADYYGISLREAKLNAEMHTPEQLATMREFLADGGKARRA